MTPPPDDAPYMPARRLTPGDTVHGFAEGLFGRDFYHCRTVEAIGRDWAVFREVDGEAVFLLSGNRDLTSALDHLQPVSLQDIYGDDVYCCSIGEQQKP